MKLKGIIIDADFCIKLGASPKYRYLEKVLTELADKVYIHRIVYDEILAPICAKEQVDSLMKSGKLELIDESCLEPLEKTIYQGIYKSLANVMINPMKPRKNLGETCSLAMAKTKGIPYFATDEIQMATKLPCNAGSISKPCTNKGESSAIIPICGSAWEKDCKFNK